MTEMFCTYGDGRDEALVAMLYDETDGSAAGREAFEAHVQTCARCRADLAALRGVRTQLARWSPPQPTFVTTTSPSNQQSAFSNQPWWRSIPAWAQVAAALLFLGVSAGIANLDVRYDQNGLSVKTGWSQRLGEAGRSGETGRLGGAASTVAQAGLGNAPWQADLTALESQLKKEIRTTQASVSGSAAAVRAVAASSSVSDAEVTRRVRALIEESEKRQQRELA